MEMPRTQMRIVRRLRPCKMNNSKEWLNLIDLPMELVVEILKRVPAKSVCRIRCVSKMLLGIVDSPSFVKLHSTFLLDPDSHLPPDPPQLILRYLRSHCSTTKNDVSTFHSLHYDPSKSQGAQLNARFILQSSKPTFYYSPCFVFCNLFGIKYRGDDALSFLINPLQGEVLRLPPSRCIAQHFCGSYSKYSSIGMGFDSITNTYKILRVSRIHTPKYPTAESCWVSEVLVLGTNEWRQSPSAQPPGYLHWSKNVCAHGDMHWLFYSIDEKIHLLSFDFKKEMFFWIPNPSPNPYVFPVMCTQLHLITLKGSMAIVDTTSGTNIEIWVMKDYSKKQWMLDYSISIHMLELDSQFEFMQAVCCEWEHGILFIDKPGTITVFLDLRGPVVSKNLIKCPLKGCDLECRRITGVNGSLISLKSYANLVDAEESATYSNWTEAEASGNNFFYLKGQ